MRPACRSRCGMAILLLGWLPPNASAQSGPASIRPLRTSPTAAFQVDGGFRDWGPTTISGTTALAGSPTGKGGVHAVDVVTGKLKWSFRPLGVNGSVSTAPGVSGGIVIAPYGAANPGAVIGVSLATGKEVWRGPDPATNAAVATEGDLAFVVGKDGVLYALVAATGREAWRVAAFRRGPSCLTAPVVREGTLYLTGTTDAGSFLLALDPKTGTERWRYRACLRQPVVTATTIFATGEDHLYAVDRATGKDRWTPVETRRPVEGRNRLVTVEGLVDGGSVVVGITDGFIMAFDQASGRIAWELPGEFGPNHPSTAVAGTVLYFQGSPATKPAPAARGTLYALDLATREILWSFSRPTAEANWPFGTVTPVDGGLWVDSYRALVKLR